MNNLCVFHKHVRSELYHNIFAKIMGKKKYSELFWKTYYWLEKTKSWNYNQFREYQMYKLQKQINHAYQHTTYYRRLFDEHGWKPQDFQNFNDFKKIPVLTKEEWRKHIEELRALPRRKCRLVTTGGSTGIPTPIYHELDKTSDVYSAFVWQWYNEGGYYLGDRAVVLRGSIIKDGCYEFSEDSNELHCSSMKMSERNMKEYLIQIQKYRAAAICAYPSSAELLAKFIENTNVSFNEDGRIKSLFTSSESLTNKTRKLIEEKLHLRVYDLYGNSEQMGMIAQLRDGLYHEYMCHSYIEYLDAENRPVKKGKGKIVATGFINEAMPVLRYDTDDFAEVVDKKYIMKYNAQKIIKDIYGRRERKDLLIGCSGNKVNVVAINSHADIFDHVYKWQYVQEERGRVKLNIMPNDKFTRIDFINIQQEFKNRLGETFELDVVITDQFEYTIRGKQKLLIQKLNIEN